MLTAFALACMASAGHAALPGYTQHDFTLPPDTGRFIIVDANDNGLGDLLTVAGRELRLFLQDREQGFDFAEPDAGLTLPGGSLGWDLSGNYPAEDGTYPLSVIALIDGSRVTAWHFDNGGFGEKQELLDDVDGALPRGVHRIGLSRDLNGNGRDDLVIPGTGELMIHMRNPDGSYQRGLPVLSRMQLSTTLHGGDTIGGRVGQSVEIPAMELRDVNADGYPDLIVDTDERLDVFLANAGEEGEYFPGDPTFSVDRAEIRERLGSLDVDQLDLSNLTGALALTHEEILADVTGNGIDDMVLREGGRIALYTGGADGVDFSEPRQILRSSGNVWTVFLHDENGNGRPDLWLWRVERISLRDVFLWLALSGSIDIEAFVYHNQGESFARRPGRRITVTLRLPSALRLRSSLREFRERARDADAVIPMVRARTDDHPMQDLLVLMHEQLRVFRNALEPEVEDDGAFLASLDYSRDRDEYEIDIRRMIEDFDLEINRDLHRMGDREPDIVLPLPGARQHGAVMTADINDNGRDDVFVFLERSRDAVRGLLLLSD